jgi:NNP family nitrate/nitrite transporter-like MFS transporter
VVAVLYFLASRSFEGFFLAFMVLFLATGIGNGSTYRMIPVIFRTEREQEVQNLGEGVVAEARRQGLKEGAFALGFIGAVAAYGGFIIPRAFGASLEATGGPQAALMMFIVFYVTCVAATWYFYCRRSSKVSC